MLNKIRPYAKAAVAIAGLVVVAANMVITGTFDQGALVDAGVAVLVALGVYHLPNKA